MSPMGGIKGDKISHLRTAALENFCNSLKDALRPPPVFRVSSQCNFTSSSASWILWATKIVLVLLLSGVLQLSSPSIAWAAFAINLSLSSKEFRISVLASILISYIWCFFTSPALFNTVATSHTWLFKVLQN